MKLEKGAPNYYYYYCYNYFVELEEGPPTCGDPGDCGCTILRDHPSPTKAWEVLVDQHKVGSGPSCTGQGPWGLLELSWCCQPSGSDCSAQGLWLVLTAICESCPPKLSQQGKSAKVSPGTTGNDGRFAALKGSSWHPLSLEKLVSSSFQGTDLYLSLKTPPTADAGAWWAVG